MQCTSQKEQFDMSFMKIGLCWKFYPTWPFNDLLIIFYFVSLTYGILYFCDPSPLISNLIYMKGHLKPHLTPTWPSPTRNGSIHLICQNIFWPGVTLKLSITQFRQNGPCVFFHYSLQISFIYRLLCNKFLPI